MSCPSGKSSKKQATEPDTTYIKEPVEHCNGCSHYAADDDKHDGTPGQSAANNANVTSAIEQVAPGHSSPSKDTNGDKKDDGFSGQ